MKRLAVTIALLLTAVAADAATLSFQFTTPTANNLAPCDQPMILVPAIDSVTVRWTASGPSLTAADSIRTVRGVTKVVNYPGLPGGTYVVSCLTVRRSSTSGLWIPACAPLTKAFVLADTASPDTVTLTCPTCQP